MGIIQTFDQLLELPLFQGMTRNDLDEVLTYSQLKLLHINVGKTIVHEGDPCNRLYFIVEGTYKATTYADDRSYAIVEKLKGPRLIQPERIFGFNQRFTKKIEVDANCKILTIEKREVVKLTEKFEIFRINLFNIVTTQAQRISHIPFRPLPTNIRQKIGSFIKDRCEYPAGQKDLIIKMQTLANYICESRLNVSKELRKMQAEGLAKLGRCDIRIIALEKLLITDSPKPTTSNIPLRLNPYTTID